MEKATIFVNESRLLRRERPNVGVRFDTQVLPTGSWVAGQITRNERMLEQPVGVTDADWQNAIRYAEDVLSDRWQSDDDYPEML